MIDGQTQGSTHASAPKPGRDVRPAPGLAQSLTRMGKLQNSPPVAVLVS